MCFNFICILDTDERLDHRGMCKCIMKHAMDGWMVLYYGTFSETHVVVVSGIFVN